MIVLYGYSTLLLYSSLSAMSYHRCDNNNTIIYDNSLFSVRGQSRYRTLAGVGQLLAGVGQLLDKFANM